MRLVGCVVLSLVVAGSALAADTPVLPITSLCASHAPGAPRCNVPKEDLKQAKAAFSRALKLQRAGRLDEALDEFEAASQLVPQDVEMATARELVRQQLVYNHLERGNAALLDGRQIQALGEFRTALHLDPQNKFAQQRLTDALGESTPQVPGYLSVLEGTGEILLQPEANRSDFHFRGNSRELLTQVAKAYGITAMFDDSVLSRRVRFEITDVDFYTAMQAACDVTKTFWTPLAARQLMLAADTPGNHREFDRMAARTFLISGATTPQELNEVVNVLRNIFEIRFITQRPSAGLIAVRAPQRMLDAATEFLEDLDSSRPEVVLELRLYQVSHTLTRNMGLQIPNQFTLFNIPASALAALGGQNIQDLINQLIASGGINQANTTAISALLAQLQGQQNSIFSQPLATFGNGLTLFGLSLGTAGATLSMNESSVQTLEHAILRASDGQDATFRVGSRFPILNASFAPIFNSAAIAQVIGNNTFTAAFPSFNYEDLGLTFKAKPQIHSDSAVSLNLELQLRSLGTTSLNGVPVISNREYKGTINLRDGEPAVVAGAVSRTEQRSLSGIPGLGNVPLLNKVTANNTKENDEDELLIVIVPHIVGEAASGSSEVWMSNAR
jgi:general secretion pathway protein D